MFNNKFDYSNFKYTTAKNKSEIICPTHGSFLQNMDKHTAKNSKGCPKCWNENRPFPTWLKKYKKQIISFKVFVEKADKIFQNQYNYIESTYKGMSSKMTIVCKKHGNFESLPESFLKSKIGCNKCARISAINKMTDSYDDFINQSNKIHNNKYTYCETNRTKYINKKSTIRIKCKEHGYFNKKAQKHIAGQGCFKCKIRGLIEKNILVGDYSEDLFNNKPDLKTKSAILYLLKINNYYKIGISTKDINNRIKGLKASAKRNKDVININILKIQKDTLYNCFLKEQLILQENKQHRIFKKWSTELLKNIDIEKYF
jgi:hypothetical protein